MIIIEIAIMIICLSLSIGIFMFLNILKKYLNNKLNNENERFYLDLKINKDNYDILDDIIEYEMNNYQLMHPDVFALDGSSYIKEGEMKDIVANITAAVIKNITPAIRAKLKLMYNFNSNEELITLVGRRAGVLIAMLASEVNSAIEDETTGVSMTNLEL